MYIYFNDVEIEKRSHQEYHDNLDHDTKFIIIEQKL